MNNDLDMANGNWRGELCEPGRTMASQRSALQGCCRSDMFIDFSASPTVRCRPRTAPSTSAEDSGRYSIACGAAGEYPFMKRALIFQFTVFARRAVFSFALCFVCILQVTLGATTSAADCGTAWRI